MSAPVILQRGECFLFPYFTLVKGSRAGSIFSSHNLSRGIGTIAGFASDVSTHKERTSTEEEKGEWAPK